MAVSHAYNQAAGNFTGTVTVFNSQASTTTVAATALVRPQDWNSAHNQFYSLLGNTSLSSTASGTNVQFSGTGKVTLIGSSDTIVFSVANASVSQIEPYYQIVANSSLSSLGQSTMYLQHIVVPENMSFCRMNRIVSISVSANYSGQSNAASTGSRSNSWGYTETIGIYGRDVGGNSTQLTSYYRQTWSMGMFDSANDQSGGATTMSISRSALIGYPGQINSTGGYTSSTFSSTNSTQASASSISITNILSNVSGVCMLPVPLATTLSAGDWWIGILGASGATSAGTATTLMSMSQAILTGYTSNFKQLGQTATATGVDLVQGNGFWNAQIADLSSPIPFSSINNNSNQLIYFNIAQQTL